MNERCCTNCGLHLGPTADVKGYRDIPFCSLTCMSKLGTKLLDMAEKLRVKLAERRPASRRRRDCGG